MERVTLIRRSKWFDVVDTSRSSPRFGMPRPPDRQALIHTTYTPSTGVVLWPNLTIITDWRTWLPLLLALCSRKTRPKGRRPSGHALY